MLAKAQKWSCQELGTFLIEFQSNIYSNIRSTKKILRKIWFYAKKMMKLPHLTALLYGTRTKYIQHIAKKLAPPVIFERRFTIFLPVMLGSVPFCVVHNFSPYFWREKFVGPSIAYRK
jgi:hypothetical protein